MEAKPRSVVIYQTRSKACPWDDWFNSLADEPTKNKILARINRLRLGLFGDCDSAGKGVSELRMDFGPGYRVYFGQDGLEVVMLTGGDKSSQTSDIEDAKEYWEDYKTRKRNANKTEKK